MGLCFGYHKEPDDANDWMNPGNFPKVATVEEMSSKIINGFIISILHFKTCCSAQQLTAMIVRTSANR